MTFNLTQLHESNSLALWSVSRQMWTIVETLLCSCSDSSCSVGPWLVDTQHVCSDWVSGSGCYSRTRRRRYRVGLQSRSVQNSPVYQLFSATAFISLSRSARFTTSPCPVLSWLPTTWQHVPPVCIPASEITSNKWLNIIRSLFNERQKYNRNSEIRNRLQ